MKKIVVFLVIALSGCVFAQNGWRLVDSTFGGTCVCFVDSLKGFSNADGLKKTTDGGYTWTSISIDGFSGTVNEIKFLDNTTGFASCNGGLILKTTDGGAAWRVINTGTSDNLYMMTFTVDRKIFCATDTGPVLRSFNMGETWGIIQISSTPHNMMSLGFRNNEEGWICGHEGQMFKTIDGGTHWSADSTFLTGIVNNVDLRRLCFTDSLNGYLHTIYWVSPMLGNNYSIIYKTSDGGKNWASLYQTSQISNMTVMGLQNIWLGCYEGIKYSSNGGVSWVDQYVPCTNMFFLDSRMGWDVFSKRLYKTIDGGNSIPNSPKLISPENFSSPNSTIVNLVWSKPTNTRASSFHLQVAKDLSFSTIVFEDSTLTDTICQFTGQKWTRYYWRVSAKGEDSTGQYSSAFIFTTQYNSAVTAPQAPVLLYPMVNSTIAILNPPFQWVQPDNGAVDFYRLQIATDINFTSMLYNDAVYKDSLTDIYLSANTKYYWRVSANNAGGAGTFSSVGSFMTDTALLHYTDPSFFPFHIGDTWYYNHGSSWVNTTKTIVDTMPLGKWKIRIYNYRNGTIDTSYEYWQYYDGKFSMATIGPLYVNYLMRDSSGSLQYMSSTSSKSWKLTTVALFGEVLTAQEYNYFYRVDPYSSSYSTIKIAKYLGIYYVSGFISSSRGPSYNHTLDSLVACNIGGVLRGTIPVQTLPVTPFCDSPADKYKYSGLSLTLKWGYSDVNSVAYFKVQIAKDSGFTKIVIDTNVVPKSWQSLDISGLDTSTTYYWHVQGVNYLGAGEYCKSFSFTTADYPITIAPTRAVSSDTILDRPPVLRWSPPANTKIIKYEIWIAPYMIPYSPFVQTTTADTFFVFKNAKKNTLYYWAVRAINNGNIGPYSDPFAFKTTSNDIAITTVPIGTVTMGSILDYPPVLKWHLMRDSTVQYYKLQIAADYQNGALIQPYEATVADTTFAFLSAVENKTYYWRVCGANSDTTGSYSDVYNFKTTSLLSTAPAVHAAEAIYNNQDTTVEFLWDAIVNADVTFYQLQIASDEGFADIVYDNAALTETKVMLSKLEPNKTYYWHVRAVNAYHSSPFSTTTSFKYGEPRVYQFSLDQNYPNPFNPKTVITYSLPGDGFVSLKMYNAMGAEVRTLVSGYQTMNKYVIDVSLPDLPSGVYIYRLTQGGNIQTKKLMLLK